jgi:hypothetical protein
VLVLCSYAWRPIAAPEPAEKGVADVRRHLARDADHRHVRRDGESGEEREMERTEKKVEEKKLTERRCHPPSPLPFFTATSAAPSLSPGRLPLDFYTSRITFVSKPSFFSHPRSLPGMHHC